MQTINTAINIAVGGEAVYIHQHVMARTLFGTKKKKMNETRKEKKIAMFRTNFD